MTLCFTLSMPNRGSWNGGWSGASRRYSLVKNAGNSKKAKERNAALLAKGSFRYSWSDGWSALVIVREITANQARLERRISDGFCGYEWMVESIFQHGAIYASQDEIPKSELTASDKQHGADLAEKAGA